MSVVADRAERLLALLLLQQLKGASQKERAKALSLAGYSNLEIADLLETTPAAIATMRYQVRQARRARSKKNTRK